MEPSFCDFPEDVQLAILSFLAPTDISNFSCTSKRFVSLSQADSKLWFTICTRKWGSKTHINKWGNGQISYKLLYKTLSKWDHLIGFWRRIGPNNNNKLHQVPPSLIFFEWGPTFLSGSRVSPSQDGSFKVVKTPFLYMSVSPDGQIVSYVDFDGQNGELVNVSVDFIGDTHFSVEERVGRGGSEEEGGDMVEMYQYYANKTSPGAAERAWRRQRRREKERQGRVKWETEHFLKILDSHPTPARPLQGLWKGLRDEMKLEFFLVAYDGVGITCRRVGDLSERLSICTPMFWTSNPTFIEYPFSPDEKHLYDSRMHIRPPAGADNVNGKCPLIDDEVVTGIMCINSSYDLVIPGLTETSANPWRVEGRIWQYKNGTFGFGFLRDNFIIDLKHISRNGCLLDTMEVNSECSD